ncbi:MAG: lipid A export permease/ATP-binding protein MsbA [Burkholderiaceae bacterium]|jgi:subfamily B ATP-binding cassette protein MsbA|nr:lipid A export permease/ATP-binding protein MsbA [Burkholderiaceae bacterium]
MIVPPHIKRLLALHRPYKARLALAFLAMTVTASLEPVIPYFFKVLLDHGFTQDSDFPYWLVPAIVIALFVVRGTATFSSTYLLNWISSRLLTVLRRQMFDRMLDVSAGFFETYSVGRTLNTIMYEVQQIIGMITNVMTSMIRSALTVLGLLIWLFYLNWKLSLITLILFPLVSLVVRFTGRKLRKLNQESLTLNAQLTQNIEEVTQAHSIVKLFGSEEFERYRFERRIQEIRRYTMRTISTFASTVPITQLITACTVAVIIVIALYQYRSGSATVGGFVSFLTAMLMILAPMKQVIEVNGPLQRGLASAEAVFDLIDAPIERTNGVVLSSRVKGQVDFVDVGFRYPGANRDALHGVNLSVSPGETIAIVGMSGGGKTTLVNLLPEFFPVTEGVVMLDGMPLGEMSLKSLRDQIAMVSQHVILFDDTVTANVAYGDSSPDMEKVNSAIDAAHLRGVVNNLESGLGTRIGRNGSRLSGGQRQRLAIARAVYKDAPILILDEATSALDTESEREVQSALDQLMNGRTTLVIAHRLSTIEGASRIVVLAEGRVIEIGTHDALLERDGTYANLYRLQFAREAQENNRPA